MRLGINAERIAGGGKQKYIGRQSKGKMGIPDKKDAESPMAAEEGKPRSTEELTRRELNTAMLSGAIGLLSANPLRALSAIASQPIETSGAPNVRLVHQRAWKIGDADESTHVLGNGRMMVHECGPNIVYLRGPWISTPNLMTMTLVDPASISTVSSRERGTTIWHHQLFVGPDRAGEIIDVLENDKPCLRRILSSKTALILSIRGPRMVRHDGRTSDRAALVGQWPFGTSIFADFKSSHAFTVQVDFPDQARVEMRNVVLGSGARQSTFQNDLPHETLLHLPAGEFEVLIAAGSDLDECFRAADSAGAIQKEHSLSQSRLSWRSRLAQVKWTSETHEEDLPVEAVVDDVTTLLLGHQSIAGSVCAGQFYPLFYVRDQYGVSRALLAANLKTEAKAILTYYFAIWQKYGRIHNAQSDGPRHFFHRAENDDVELTGYCIVQAFDYLRATGDEEFIAAIFPMLLWALEVQQAQLFAHMLPFNGDETYVAGGIFPRTHLTDGSSEATLLYLAAADRILNWPTAQKLIPSGKLQQHRQTAEAVRSGYAGNFIVNGRVTVNRPRVPDRSLLPRFRYGVCLGQYDSNCLFLADTEIAEDGRYFCYSCYAQRTREMYEAKNYFIPSAALTSFLVHYDVLSDTVSTATVSDALGVFTNNGKFEWPRTTLPGYETAVVSLALAQLRHPRSVEFIRRTLDLRDSTGAWAEYYTEGKPQGCRARPWESALSLVALLRCVAK